MCDWQERILTRIHYHLNPDAREEDCTMAECIPHQQFAMKVTEQVAARLDLQQYAHLISGGQTSAWGPSLPSE